jgi:hypothetical protein
MGREIQYGLSSLIQDGSITNAKLAMGFGGTGTDGALAISSGTTTLDLGGAAFYIKNYTSISITGTGKLAFTNPGTNGTIIILKSQGSVTLTSSTVPNIDVSAMGGQGAPTPALSAIPGTDGSTGAGTVESGQPGGAGQAVASGAGGLPVGTAGAARFYPLTIAGKTIKVACGGGGASGGGAGGGTGDGFFAGSGGVGGGALIVECRGALNFTGSIWSNGVAGGNGQISASGAAAGGGGGAGGTVAIIYGGLTANIGTITCTGGNGGTGGSPSGAVGTNVRGTGGGGGGNRFAGGAGGKGGTGTTGTGTGGTAGTGGTKNTAGGTGGDGTAGTCAGGGGGGGAGGSDYVVSNVEIV